MKLAGVDLVAYGAKERLRHETEKVHVEDSIYYGPLRSTPSRWIWNENEDSYFPIRIIGFAYGPEPEDWQIWA
ncbi:uncharacterized protein BDV17DRAFT_256742 [Aspergillus undulatus]|uniref:uncharacterized protein n=1 Tax=Aspergillus undulatus TaxID=1810928 RepID=UPI003CCCB470